MTLNDEPVKGKCAVECKRVLMMKSPLFFFLVSFRESWPEANVAIEISRNRQIMKAGRLGQRGCNMALLTTIGMSS